MPWGCRVPDTQPVVIVEISVSRQWGGPQQKSVTALLYWHCQTDNATVLKVEDLLHRALSALEFGEFTVRSEGAEKVMEQLGKEQQLTLCSLPPNP